MVDESNPSKNQDREMVVTNAQLTPNPVVALWRDDFLSNHEYRSTSLIESIILFYI